jgi:MFS-type transporter involved in bile tolerance (Atg22 family)
MANMLGRIWKEYIFGISIALLIVGMVTFIFGVLGTFFKDTLTGFLTLDETILAWSLYVLIIGAVVALTGGYYLYSFLKNKRFLLKELETKKRSEFMKNHAELKTAARHLPSKYQFMFSEKEKEFRIK